MKSVFTRFASLLLVLVMIFEVLPVEAIGESVSAQIATAEAVKLDAREQDALEEDFRNISQKASETAVPLDDGEWQYTIVDSYAVITGHRDGGETEITIPRTLGGVDVVALEDGVFSGHDNLIDVTVIGNIYYVADGVFPRGVTICGYNGSYALRWAAEHRYASRNLSELDFLSNVVDCTDLEPSSFSRYDQNHLSMRALESRRLHEGSIFFLVDPNNQYAVSYYTVDHMEEAGKNVEVYCTTPDISQVLNSFHADNQVMMPNMDTLEVYADTGYVLAAGSHEYSLSGEKGLTFEPEVKLKNGTKLKFSVGYNVSSTFSADYSNLKLNSFKVTQTQTTSLSASLSSKTNFMETDKSISKEFQTEDIEEIQLKDSDFINDYLERCSSAFSTRATSFDSVDSKLARITLFSLGGIFSGAITLKLKCEFSGQIGVTYEYTTTDEYVYAGGKLVSRNIGKKENELSAELSGKASFGLDVSLSIYLFVIDIAQLSAFIGLRGTAKLLSPSTDLEHLLYEERTTEEIVDNMNMLDCVSIKLEFVVEISASVGYKDVVTLLSLKETLLSVPLCELHFHLDSMTFIYEKENDTYYIRKSTLEESAHKKDNCPFEHKLLLMVPSLDKKNSMGSASLDWTGKVEEPPVLIFDELGLRVNIWYTRYKNEKFDDVIRDWNQSFKSGTKIYGKTVPVSKTEFVDFTGEPLVDSNGNPVFTWLADLESVSTAKLDLCPDYDIIGWQEVNNRDDMLPIGDIMWRPIYNCNYCSNNRVICALMNNDLTVEYTDLDGNTNSFTGSNYYGVEAPDISGTLNSDNFNPEKFNLVWINDSTNEQVQFPYRATAADGNVLRIHAKKVFKGHPVPPTDPTPTVLSAGVSYPSGAQAYSDPSYFKYTSTTTAVTITGINTTLTIPETLVIPDCISDKPVTAIAASAFKGQKSLVRVVLPYTISSIGYDAFRDCTNLTVLDLSACGGLTSLPSGVAQGDTALSYVVINSSVKSIGSSAFSGCTQLTKAVLNASLGTSAFSSCTGLSQVEFLSGAKSIGGSAFSGCTALKELTVPYYVSTIGSSFLYGCTGLTKLVLDGTPSELTSSIISIGTGSQLAEVVLNDGVLSIGEKAFSGHPKLKSLTLPETLEKVGASALTGTSIEHLKIYNLDSMGSDFARDCTTLRELEFEQGTIGSYAFSGCTGLEKVTLGKHVRSIGSYAFQNCTSLSEVAGGGNVTSIGRSAFSGCSALQAFDAGDRIASIGESAFSKCTNLKTLNVGTELKSVGSSAFGNCTSLDALYLPPTVASYGSSLIHGARIKTLSLGGPACPTISEKVFNGSDCLNYIQKLIINEGVTAIGANAFYNGALSVVRDRSMTSLTLLSLPSTLKSIGSNAFEGAGANSASLVVQSAAGIHLNSIGDAVFSGSTNMISFDAPADSIGNYAFCNCINLKEINLGTSVTSIGSNAFSGCSALQAFDAGDRIASIGESAFSKCTSLKTLNVGTELKSVGSSAFGNCTSLDALYLPPTVASYGSSLIYGTRIKTLSLGGPACPTISEKVFNGSDCLNYIQKLIINEGVTAIGSYAFYNNGLSVMGERSMTSLTLLSLPSTLKSIGSNAFEGAGANSASLVVQSAAGIHLNSIGDAAFRGSTNMISFDAPADSIGNYAFYNCINLKEINLGTSVTSIGSYAFYGCSSLQAFDAGDRIASIGELAFSKCTNLKTLNVGTELKSVGSYAFNNCTSLDALYLPPTVASYGTSLIYGTRIKTLSLGGPACPTISEKVFNSSNCLNYIQKLIINEGVTAIGANAFYNSQSMTSLTLLSLPSTVNSIGSYAFYKASKLTSVLFPDTIESFASNAFASCPSLTMQTTQYNEAVANAAKANGQKYVYDFGGEFTLTLVKDGTAETHTMHYGDALADLLGQTAWYLDEGCSAKWRAETMPGFDVTLYAGKRMEDGLTLTLKDIHDKTIHTINLSHRGNLTDLLAASVPADENGTTFRAWYMDADRKQQWYGTQMPFYDLTLYAGMVTAHSVHCISILNGKTVANADLTVGEGMPIPMPRKPVLSDSVFVGWFTDADMTIPFRVGTAMGTDDITLYGKVTTEQTKAIYTVAGDHAVLAKLIVEKGDSTDAVLLDYYNGLPVTRIADEAFYTAADITTLQLPDKLETINADVLAGLNNLTAVTASAESQNFASRRGMLYSKDMSKLLFCPADLRITEFWVPHSVAEIGAYAFGGNRWLRTVVLPDSVTTLGTKAFFGCGELESFTAYGLTSIGTQALPEYAPQLHICGPVLQGALRDYALSLGTPLTYNLCTVILYIDGAAHAVLGAEAGTPISYAQIYGQMDNGKVIHTWYTDAAMTKAWDPTAPVPKNELKLYSSWIDPYSYELLEESAGIRLTAYNGTGGELILPTMIDDLPVISIGADFLADCHGIVRSVQIGDEVTEIADTALVAPDAYPFGGIVKVNPDTYAEEWAIRMGYIAGASEYTLLFKTDGGTVIPSVKQAAGSAKRLPIPVKDGCEFIGWYLDDNQNEPVTLEDGCFIMPGHDVVLYAAWSGDACSWPFTFEIDKNQITITGLEEKVTELVIPETINGLPVTAIAARAFSGSTALRSVSLPQNMRTVGQSAFAESAVESVHLGGTSEIAVSAFAGCINLTQINAEAVTSVGKDAFYGCINLSSFHVGTDVQSISAECFRGCTALAAFTVDSENTTYYAVNGVLYKNGYSLVCYPAGRMERSFTVPDEITKIEVYAFADNTWLTEIDLPDAVNSLQEGAFYGCTALEAVTVPENVYFISKNTFANCSSLAEVSLGSKIIQINSGAFAGCMGLTEIEIPERVISIEDMAFPASFATDLTIRGTYGSEAWRFAAENGYTFVAANTVAVTALEILLPDRLESGSITELSARITPDDADLCGELEWSTDDPGILYAHEGQLYAVGYGKTTVRVAAPNGITGSKTISVPEPVTVLSYPAYIQAGKNGTIQLKQTEQQLNFTVDNAEILAVDDSGNITALKPGMATVRIDSESGTWTSCNVAVVDSCMFGRQITLTPGQAIEIVKQVPDGVSFRWVPSKSNIVAVNDETITAVNVGSTVLNLRLGQIDFPVYIEVVDTLDTLKLPAALTEIDDDAFTGLPNVMRIELANVVSSIGQRAFAENYALLQVEIAAADIEIADDAFSDDPDVVFFCLENDAVARFAEKNHLPYVLIKSTQP